VHALAALFCLQAARLPARVDDAGDLLTLASQTARCGTPG
jgi:predicted RNA polymerase sigma factor